MNNKKVFYNVISIVMLLITITILAVVDKSNNVRLSSIIQIIMMAYILKITWGCVLYVREQYKKHKYSYAIVMNLGLMILDRLLNVALGDLLLGMLLLKFVFYLSSSYFFVLLMKYYLLPFYP